MKRKNDKKMKKELRRFWNRYGGLFFAGAILLATFACFHREMVMKLLWAVLLAAVPVAAVCLIFCLILFKMEEKQHRQKNVSGSRNGYAQKREQPAPATVREWYCGYAKARLARLVCDLEREGISAVWIRPDGVCNVSTQKGYRRRAVLSDYPEEYADVIAEWIRQDHIASARRDGKYLRLTFGTARRAA